MTRQPLEELSRRRLLRGAVVLGGAVYSVPVVQVLNMSAASAAAMSGAPADPPSQALDDQELAPAGGPDDTGARPPGPGADPLQDGQSEGSPAGGPTGADIPGEPLGGEASSG